MKTPLQRFRSLSAIDNTLPERVIRIVAERVLAADDVAIDAGAFMGLHTKHLLNTCRDGKVIAYEANPTYASRLSDQFRRYGHVAVRNVALVGDPDQSNITFHVDDEFPSRSTLHVDDAQSSTTRIVSVAATTLDADLVDVGIDPAQVAFVKLDVEGAEFEALRGARSLLGSRRPLVVLEHGADAPRLGGYETAEFDEWVHSIDYTVLAFDGTRLNGFDTAYWYFWLVPVEQLSETAPEIAAAFDTVLGEQEDPTLPARVRRRLRVTIPGAKKALAHRLPETVKRQLRRTFPRL